MDKEFVPYELAVKLEELGFDEPCFGLYEGGKIGYSWATSNSIVTPIDCRCNSKFVINILTEDCCTAPTFSQAFRWFRENHDLLGIPTHSKFTIMSNKWVGQPLYGNYNSYEEAELACLNKLIEIVETKSE